LPEVVRSDNGEPFAGLGLARLSRLAVWWLRLGIRLDRIRLGRPQDNGAHERFHRTLKEDTTRPPAYRFTAQQRRFDRHRAEFNTVRPHEALGDDTPAMHYLRSPRALPPRLPPPEYPSYDDVRRVTSNGCFKWHSQCVFVTHVLTDEDIGLEPIDDGLWTVHFAAQPIGRFDERRRTVTDTYEVAAAASTGPPSK
jgi:putative transposase